MSRLRLGEYRAEIARRPTSGRHLLAQHDDESVVVYQAYRASIARFAAEQGRLGGEGFSFSRMSWIKPSFLWMMFRCGWATKEGQERVLALWLKRDFFDALLERVVPSAWIPTQHDTREEWQRAVKRSDVRLQWDPDHGPGGTPVERRTIQLGLRGDALAALGGDAIVALEDITALVEQERARRQDAAHLRIPIEDPYAVRDPSVRLRLGLSD